MLTICVIVNIFADKTGSIFKYKKADENKYLKIKKKKGMNKI